MATGDQTYAEPYPEPRVTDECLARVIKSPTTFPAWVLRAVARELVDLRAALLEMKPTAQSGRQP